MTATFLQLCCLLSLSNAVERYGFMMPSLEREVNIDEHFYYVSLSVRRDPSHPLTHLCGGALIGESWVLTTSSCTDHVPKDKYEMWVSSRYFPHLQYNPYSTKSIHQKVENIYVNHNGNINHKRHKTLYQGNDIALLKLKSKFLINRYIQPIKIYKKKVKPDIATLAGYGVSKKLRTVQVGFQESTRCNLELSNRTGVPNALQHDMQICYKSLSRDTVCIGDTGSPLVVKVNDQYQLVGLFSWTLLPCYTNGDYAVYTDVFKFQNWIHETITQESGDKEYAKKNYV